jgi:aminopeptidase N
MPHRTLIGALALSLVIGVGLTAPATAETATTYRAGAAPTAGSNGAGDPYFPLAGNGGYDVRHYHLDLSWNPSNGVLTGSELILATATQALSSFNLDLRPALTVAGVKVNGRPAAISRDGQELTVTPERPLADPLPFLVQVNYSGVPEFATDPDGSPDGWIRTDDGVFVAGEPQGAPTWFAVNDTPKDKATYDISMTVPDGLTAVGNGALVSQRSRGGRSIFSWVERYPMSPYLATITIGKFDVTKGRTPKGVPTYVAVDPTQAEAANPVLAKLPEIVDYFSDLYGRYPFENAGAIVDNAPDVGYALETQTKPVFDRAPDESTLVHELAHQWFGDAVTLTSWPDIWLNEGFATWSEWIWTEQHGGDSAQSAFDALYARPETSSIWSPPTAVPGDGAHIFGSSVYNRGAMTLQALRVKIGDELFFKLMRTWYASNKYGNVTTKDFIALSNKISGQDLSAFFTIWLYTDGKPAPASW